MTPNDREYSTETKTTKCFLLITWSVSLVNFGSSVPRNVMRPSSDVLKTLIWLMTAYFANLQYKKMSNCEVNAVKNFLIKSVWLSTF